MLHSPSFPAPAGTSERDAYDRPGTAAGQASPYLSDGARLKNILGKKMGATEESWFSPLSFSMPQDGTNTLRVSLPHPLFYRWFCLIGRPLLEKTARDMFGTDLHIVYEHGSETLADREVPAPSGIPAQLEDELHGPRFSDFITGGRNREVLRILKNVLGDAPCTLLLLGASGTGKSLLLRAAAAELRQSRSDVLFFPCRDLIALFRNSPSLAHDTLVRASAVVIDDIQLLEDHTDVQQELALILDEQEGRTFFIAAYQTDELDGGGQKLLPSLYDRLCSHLSLGLAEPDLDVRLRFAQIQMTRNGLPEHRSTALFIARRCLRLRHVRGVLEQVRRRYEQSGALPPQNELASMIGRAGAPQPPDVDHILAVVASRYGCSSEQLRENTREKSLTLPRQIAMYLCRELLGESYPSLGLIFGGKDHSTIMYAVKKIGKMKVTNKDAHMQLTELTKQCLNSSLKRDTGV
jgi:chromosomal replication initiator protein